jgi:arginyl-tRNA synthetase
MNLQKTLQHRFHDALTGLVADPAPYVAMIKPAQDARHGDYQANCAMSLAKVLGKQPRQIALEIVQRLKADNLVEPPEIAGPGFINLRFKSDWLAAQLQACAGDERLGVARTESAKTIVIDFSSPNVAKPMHVGHLRSTIIGDALTRLLRFLGHQVITDNHLGDWGTQFGMLLYGYKHYRDEAALKADPVREMVRIYVEVRKLTKPAETVEDDPDARNYSRDELEKSRSALHVVRQETVKLHAGDPENVGLWKQFMPWCLAEIDKVYERLEVHIDHTHGESFYNPMLPGVVKSLQEHGLAQEGEQGAIVVHGDKPPPAIVRKRDGAFTYTTSDLATIQYRMELWKPDAILYVVGYPQEFHFKNLFSIARRWGYDKVALEHIAFGSVLGADGKLIKTREGGAIELEALLDEAVERAKQAYERICEERRERGEEAPQLSTAEYERLAKTVGIGAVKYADLSQNRTSDYVFSWDKMLAMDGNTATYMQYAYVRNLAIFRKGAVDPTTLRASPPPVHLPSTYERSLALQLLKFEEALEVAALEYRPNLITAYLWDLAKVYSGFNHNCNVLKAETLPLRQSRLLLCDLTARVIQKGLELLGIRTPERM